MTKVFTNFKRHRNFAFTMAEILLSLTIIGVVAAITLPSLTGNINERTWNTQRKALYARMSQAMALMPALNGFGSTDYNSSGSITNDTAGQAFITELGNVLKINNVCDNAHLEDCGIVSKFMPMGGNSEINIPNTLYDLNIAFKSGQFIGGGDLGDGAGRVKYSLPNTNAVAFETQNGESLVAYYNPGCKTEFLNEGKNYLGNVVTFPLPTVCANFIYDLNGKKGPNTVGKDIGFMTVLNSSDSTVVAPLPNSTQNASEGIKWEDASGVCTEQDQASRLPNIDELVAMAVNQKLVNLADQHYWSGTIFDKEQAWQVYVYAGEVSRYTFNKERDNFAVRCIKR